jgi:hypothetical protein
MQVLLLRPDAPNTFRRSARDATGAVLRTLVFERAKPVVCDAADFGVVRPDLGKAVVFAALDEQGKPTGKADWKRTADEVELMKLEAEEAAGKATKRKR